MKVFYIKVDKPEDIKECDGGAVCDTGITPIPGQISGMGPVNVNGGPDRWDNIIGGMNTQAKTPEIKKKKKLKFRKHGR